jgi:hypothetical protein
MGCGNHTFSFLLPSPQKLKGRDTPICAAWNHPIHSTQMQMHTLQEKYAQASLRPGTTLDIDYDHLILQDGEEIVELPPVPSGVKCVRLMGFPHLRSLPHLSVGVDLILISYCPEIEFDPLSDILPPTVTRFRLNKVPKVKYLPPLPSSLTSLDCHSTGLEALAPLPLGLKDIFITDCPLEIVPCLPDSVEAVYIYNCPQLTTIEGFGASLRDAIINNNPCLLNFPELPATFVPHGTIEAPGYTPAAITE